VTVLMAPGPAHGAAAARPGVDVKFLASNALSDTVTDGTAAASSSYTHDEAGRLTRAVELAGTELAARGVAQVTAHPTVPGWWHLSLKLPIRAAKAAWNSVSRFVGDTRNGLGTAVKNAGRSTGNGGLVVAGTGLYIGTVTGGWRYVE